MNIYIAKAGMAQYAYRSWRKEPDVISGPWIVEDEL
jgi:hypothetical protein